MANKSKLRETFDKYVDCSRKARSYEEDFWGLVKEFVQKHGRFEFEYDEDDCDVNLEALYIMRDGQGKRECLVKCMYIEDDELVFDILVSHRCEEGYVDEYNGCYLSELEFDDYGLRTIVGQIE